jgi:hypothetical protein
VRDVRAALSAAFRANKYIRSVGVELEGGVPRPHAELTRLADILRLRNFYVGVDMSVYVPRPEGYSCDCWSPSSEIKFWVPFERLGDLAIFIVELWRFGFRQNETCGNHIHMRFVDHEFTVSLLFNVRAVHMFQRLYHAFARKMGEKYLAREYNRYCRFYARDARVCAREVINNACNDTRYRPVNFHALYKHGTVEFRILPHADSAEEYLVNLAWIVRAVNRIVDAMLSQTFEYTSDLSLWEPAPGRHVVLDEVV